MNDDTALAEAELSRRLSDLAATTTFDPAAWDRIVRHADPTPGPHRSRWSPRWLLAVAAALVAVVGVGALLVTHGNGPDDVETSDGPTSVPDTSVPATTIPTTTTTTPPELQSLDDPATPTLTAVTGPACPPAGQGTVCVGVDRGDVDGDGRPDDVAVATVPPHGVDQLPITVRVRYATGEVEEATVDGTPYLAHLLGVTDLDGDGREEIALYTDGGAHSMVGLFMGTTRTGHLHRVGFSEPRGLWDGAALSDAAFYCPDLDGDGRNELVLWGAYADPDTRVADVTRERFHWDGDVLVSDGSTEEQVSYDDTDGDGVQDFREIGGAPCGDLVLDM
ncbi:MAG TPA: hypothetical protein VH479_08820 [Acidimicrobiales bacterium]